jgi:hypothetical protein
MLQPSSSREHWSRVRNFKSDRPHTPAWACVANDKRADYDVVSCTPCVYRIGVPVGTWHTPEFMNVFLLFSQPGSQRRGARSFGANEIIPAQLGAHPTKSACLLEAGSYIGNFYCASTLPWTKPFHGGTANCEQPR